MLCFVCVHLSSHIHPPPEVSVSLLLTVRCVISGSFQCDVEICESALLVLSISDRIILKQRAACLPACLFLLPQRIRLTEALHVWPQQLFPAFLQHHIQQKKPSIWKPVTSNVNMKSEEESSFKLEVCTVCEGRALRSLLQCHISVLKSKHHLHLKSQKHIHYFRGECTYCSKWKHLDGEFVPQNTDALTV